LHVIRHHDYGNYISTNDGLDIIYYIIYIFKVTEFMILHGLFRLFYCMYPKKEICFLTSCLPSITIQISRFYYATHLHIFRNLVYSAVSVFWLFSGSNQCGFWWNHVNHLLINTTLLIIETFIRTFNCV